MDSDFWHQKWERGDIGFHEQQVNPALVGNMESLNLIKGSRLFLPLCGKTQDIAWLLAQGYRVVGAELSKRAINELFQQLNVTPDITEAGELTRYSANNIDIWAGDIFNLGANSLGAVDAIYDRAALVALPEEMRQRYAIHLDAICHSVQQLLVTCEYNQQLHDGPPFSVSEQELQRLYGNQYQLNRLAQDDIAGGFKGKVAATISVWHLHR
ncbi:thiopurine S-methyltransferase [Lacimicrobium alkaliphilum]|uniref:Thiopurine S-methyltransferase n=1 Tax=Lacimicrobium alkaliphilum TaxID=1526571 RepID=A0A0U2Z773_9ALTE|nr:thiopurine S-methyltransferase [Lacimicrobium alkaliphilum]ALS98787.1 thiopurine S-methyltransferase [Lacimicrobium alkaliphilum]